MGRVAEERERPRAPTFKAAKEIERPAAPSLRAFEQEFRISGPRREAREQVRGISELTPALAPAAPRRARDYVEVGPPTDRIVNEMCARPDPEPDPRPGEAGGEGRTRN